MEFKYYYGNQADQFSFIRIPKAILVDPLFASLSIQSKILYGVLLDRMGLSMRNGWFDEENRVYIIYQISEIQENLGFSKKKSIDYLAELEKIGLVEKKRRGRGLPSILYIKSFMIEGIPVKSDETDPSAAEANNDRSIETETSDDENSAAEAPLEESSPAGGVQIDIPGSSAITLPEVPESTPLMNNNNINNNNINNNILSNPILSNPETEDRMGCDGDRIGSVDDYAKLIAENIDLDFMRNSPRFDRELVEGIYDLILETVVSRTPTTVIASNEYPTELVKNKFLKLNSTHIEYVIECFEHNSTKVRNIKKYLLAALFNASSTISGYYSAEVHHDMPYLSAR